MLRSTAVLNENFTAEDDSITLALCKSGTFASDSTGKVFELTEAALESGALSWKGGFVKANHDFPLKGIISETWWEPPYVMGRITGLDPTTREIMSSAAYRGVSQDSLPLNVEGVRQVKYKSNNQLKSLDVHQVKAVSGTGVSLIFFPYTPACPMSAGCGVPIKSEAIAGLPGDEVVYEYDVGRLNNAGRIVKTKEIRIWLSGDEANNPTLLKERIASEAAWGQLGVFNIYPRNYDMQVGDEITGIEPEHVVSTIVSAEPSVFNPALNTEFSKTQPEPLGGPSMDDPNKVPTIDELTAKIATLEARNADLEGQIANHPKQMETALASHEVKIKQMIREENELNASVAALKSCMPDGFEEFIATNPSKATIDATIKGLRSANPVGAPNGSQPTGANALYSSGEELYKKLGVTPEQLAKYNEVK